MILKQAKKYKKYYDILKDTTKEHVEIKLMPGDPLESWQSKVGGIPYVSHESQYPKNAKGDCLYFLAQINLAELPKLSCFPAKGLIQFWISDDDNWGLDFRNQTKQDLWKVIL